MEVSHRVCQSGMHTASPGRSRVDRQGTRLDEGVNLQYAQEAQRVSKFSTSEDFPVLSHLLANVPLLVSMRRKAIKDFTFSDSTFIPKGTHLAAIIGPVDVDEEI